MREEIIGSARLILGDAREIVPTLSGIDVIVTDPPYGVGLKKKTNDFRDSRHFDGGESLKASEIYHDTPEYVISLIQSCIEPAIATFKRAAIYSGSRMMFHYPRPASVGAVFVPNGAGCDAWGFGCFNPILYYGKCPYLATGKGSYPNSFTDNQPGERGIDHPCPKPIRWMEWLVNRASLPGHTVLDFFMGSGTTGIACAKLGRQFVGVELSEKYFDIACRRIEAAQRQSDLFVTPTVKPVQEGLSFA